MPLRNRSELIHGIVNSAAGGTLAIPGGGAVANQRCAIYGIAISTGGAMTVTVQDTSGGALSAPIAFTATSVPFIIPANVQNTDPLWQSGIGLGIQLSASTTVQVSADVWFLFSA